LENALIVAAAEKKQDGQLKPPPDGVVVRFYRIGHGDCFLLAFPGKDSKQPVYMLIDCGYKPGSPPLIHPGDDAGSSVISRIWDDIGAATGGHLDVVVITHEHQDHVNGFTKSNLEGITIGEVWLAWTEDGDDDLANQLRKTYHDKLVGLIAARNRLNADGVQEQIGVVDQMLEFELGDDTPFNFTAAANAAASGGSGNKRSMELVKDVANHNVKFIRPHEGIFDVPGVNGVRVYAMGPPRNEDSLTDLNPQGSEEFPEPSIAASPASFFSAALVATDDAPPQPLFAARYAIPTKNAATDPNYGTFFTGHYGFSKNGAAPAIQAANFQSSTNDKVADDADWRRIENDWLSSAGQLALAMNSYTNNTSLVLAFELTPGGKVLLFAGDAQRGSWLSWAEKEWDDGGKSISARDLFARTVLYKVGHHCSHNATLNGAKKDTYANIAWMAQADYGREFTAMITAVWDWAKTQKGWYHPYPPIKKALSEKASGRVFQTDTDFDKLEKPDGSSESEWKSFQTRVNASPLFFDYLISY
jgi:beta-lactamase superfamily II metal-dependent hydrolase